MFCDKILRQNSTLLGGGGVPSVFTCVLGAQYDHLIETVLLSTNRIFLLRNKTNNYGLNIIKGPGLVVLSVYAGMVVRRQLSVSSSTYHMIGVCDQSCSNQPDDPLILKFCTTEISKERLSNARIRLRMRSLVCALVRVQQNKVFSRSIQ